MIEALDCNETRNGKPGRLRPAEPSGESVSAGALTKQPHPQYPNRNSDGTLRTANDEALVHGATSERRVSLQAPLRAEIRARVLRDLGLDALDVPATLESLIERFVETSMLCSAYYLWLEEQGGPIGTRGRQRAAVAGYLSALDRQLRLAQAIGLERKSKHVDLARAFAEQERNRG